MERLSEDILHRICSFLPISNIFNVFLTCQDFGSISKDEKFWKSLCEIYFNKELISPDHKEWKSLAHNIFAYSGFDLVPLTMDTQKIRSYYHIKVILVGSSCVGKTTLKSQFVKGEVELTPFVEQFSINVDSRIIRDVNDQSYYSVEIWDPTGMVSGNINLNTYTKRFYNHTHSIILLFDLTLPESWKQVKDMYAQLQSLMKDRESSYTVIGNKMDLKDIIEVDTVSVQKWCSERKMKFFQVSSKRSWNVRRAVLSACRESLEYAKFDQILHPNLRRNKKQKEEKKKSEQNICEIS